MISKHSILEYKKGLLKGINVVVAYIPLGVTIGLMAKNSGMPTFLGLLMSFIIYGGSSEILLIKMLYLQHAFPLEIIFSVFIINIRYMLLNLMIVKKLDKKTSLVKKMLLCLGLTDETVSLIMFSQTTSKPYMFGVITLPYFAFGISTAIGVFIGDIIPEQAKNNMNFVIYIIFFALLIMGLASQIKFIRIVLLTLIIKGIFMITPFLKSMSYGLSLATIIFLSAFIYALLFHKEGEITNE